MIPARKIIEDALDLGVDTQELLDTLKENGWSLVHGPVLQRWRDQSNNEVFAYLGAVGDQKIMAREAISDRALAHMPADGVEHLKNHLLKRWGMALVKSLGQQGS